MDADRRELERRVAEAPDDEAAWTAYDRAVERAGEMGPRRSLLQAFASALDVLHSRLVWYMAGPEPLYESQRIERDIVAAPGVAYAWEGPFRTNYSPIRPGSFYLMRCVFEGHDEYEIIATDNRMGVLAGADVLGTIDYATGQLRFTRLPNTGRDYTALAATYEYEPIEINLTVDPDPAVARTLREWHERVYRDMAIPTNILALDANAGRTNYANALAEDRAAWERAVEERRRRMRGEL